MTTKGCLFTNSVLESHNRTSPVGAASVAGIERVYAPLRQLAAEAGARIRTGSRTRYGSSCEVPSSPPSRET